MSPTFLLKTATFFESEPTPEKVKELLERLPALPFDNFLIVERTDAESKGVSGSYLQTHPHKEPVYEGDFLVEYRDGLSGRHYKSYISAATVVELFTSYLDNDDRWRELAVWRDISHEFEDLCALLPPEELAASYYPDGEWENALDEKRQRDTAFWQQFDEEQAEEQAALSSGTPT